MIFENIRDFYSNLPKSGRIIAIDYGKKKTGLAISDKSQMIASPYKIIEIKGQKQLIHLLKKIAIAQEIIGIVIGVPLTRNFQKGLLFDQIIDFITKFNQETKDKYSILLFDERMSSKAVSKELGFYQGNLKNLSKCEDKIAASYMLRAVIEARRNYQSNI